MALSPTAVRNSLIFDLNSSSLTSRRTFLPKKFGYALHFGSDSSVFVGEVGVAAFCIDNAKRVAALGKVKVNLFYHGIFSGR